MSFLSRVVFCVLTITSGSLLADQLEILPQVEVVDSRLSPSNRVPGPIKRDLERNEIERVVPADTIELLQSMPSVDAMGAGGDGGLTFVSIRGGEPNFTLFMIDGIKLNDPTNSRGGGLDLNMIPQQMIDGIEVSARPASATQGSDGLSGIVNFRTRPIKGARFRGDLSSEDSKSAGLSVGGDLSDHWVGGLMLGRDNKTSGVEEDGLRQSYFLGRASGEVTEDASLDALYFLVDGDAGSFPEDSGGDRLAVIRSPETRDFRREVYGLNGEWNLTDRATIKGSGSWMSHEEDAENPGIAAGVWAAVPAVSGSRTYTRLESQFYLLAQPVDQFSVTAGLAYDREKGRSNDVIDFGGFTVPADFSLERSSWSLFTELAYHFTPQLQVQSGLRHDMPDSAADESSSSFSVAYLIPKANIALSAYYGQGYKLPSLFALGHSLVGNPNLSPEYSEAIDLGVRKRWPMAGIEAGLSVFLNEYRDLIDFEPDLFTNVNRGKVKVRGFDAQIEWEARRELTAGLHLTYSDADEALRRRPEWKGGAELRWDPGSRFSWVTSADYNGTFIDSSIPTGVVKMSAFWRVNTALNWQYTDSVRVSLGIKNLLDDDYEESIGFSNGGLTAVLSTSVAM